MILSSERICLFFAVVSVSLLGCFLFSPWREKQFDDFVAISSNPIEVGKVLCFEKAQGEISLTNLSSFPIRFQTKADCSCTTLASTSGVIQPRAKQVVQFTYSPKSIAKLDTSIQQESSDVVVSILASGVRFSKLVRINAQGVFPLVIESNRQTHSVEPFRDSEVIVPFSTAKDVQSVRLVGAPSFLTDSRIAGQRDSLTLRAKIDMPCGIHKGPLVLEFDVLNVNKAVRIELPLTVVVEKPFSFSAEVLALVPDREFLVVVRPKYGAALSKYISVRSECPQVTAQVEGADSDTLRVFCASLNDLQLPLTGCLRVTVRSEDSAGRELTLEDDIPFVISEGGLPDDGNLQT